MKYIIIGNTEDEEERCVPTIVSEMGNQTTVKTATGIWQVEYNAENRPIRWTQGSKVITMAFDRLGRRVSYREMNGTTQVAHTLFLYNGYLCIQQLFSNSPWNVYKEFIWDPTEPIATRPLAFRQYGKTATFLMYDGNKNVTDVVTVGPANTPVAMATTPQSVAPVSRKSGLVLGGAGVILSDLGMTMVKNLPEPITSSYYRQLMAAWQRAVDNSEFIRTYAETLRVCAQNSRIPKPLSLLLLKPRFPF